jgi:hypothetical protein
MLFRMSSRFTSNHPMTNVIIYRVGRGLGKLEIIILDNQILVRMDNERTVIVNDELLRHTTPVDVYKATVVATPF